MNNTHGRHPEGLPLRLPVHLSRDSSARSGLKLSGRNCRLKNYSWISASLACPGTATPQVVWGRPVWPEFWGITGRQVWELLECLRREPAWKPTNDVYTLVTDFIIPWTQHSGLGYALLINRDEPKEVQVMVSHAWRENCEDALETIIRTVDPDDVLFICALSLYQADDGAGPSIADQIGSETFEAPFRRVLEHIRASGQDVARCWRWHRCLEHLPVVSFCIIVLLFLIPAWVWGCAPTICGCIARDVTDDSWLWRPRGVRFTATMASFWLLNALATSVWLVYRRHRLFRGRMIVVPNREVDIYSRLWCVYEIFVCKQLGIPVQIANTLARAGGTSSRCATCTSEADTRRILQEIESKTSYGHLDQAVFVTTHGAWWKVLQKSLVMGSMIAGFNVAWVRLSQMDQLCWLEVILLYRTRLETSTDVVVFVASLIVAKSFSWFCMFSVFAAAEGVPCRSMVSRRALVMIISGVPLILLSCLCEHLGVLGSSKSTSVMFIGTTAVLYGFVLLSVGLLTRYAPGLLRIFRVQALVAGALFVIFAALALMQVVRHPLSKVALHYYPIVLSSACCTIGNFALPYSLFWYGAHRWGLHVKPEWRPDETGAQTAHVEVDIEAEGEAAGGAAVGIETD